MILERTHRFKFSFTHCKTYEDVFGQLKDLENEFKILKSLGVEKLHEGSEDDYHRFEIETGDPKKIHKLKEMGFIDRKELYEEEE